MATTSKPGVNSSTDLPAEATKAPASSGASSSSRPSSRAYRRLADLPERSGSATPGSRTPAAVEARAVLAPSVSEVHRSPAGSSVELRAVGASAVPRASADVRTTGAGPAPATPAQRPPLLSRIAKHPHAAPAVETLASLATTVSAGISSRSSVSASAAVGARVAAGFGGGTWSVSGLMGIAANNSGNKTGYLTNGLNVVAGGAQAAGQFTSGLGKHVADGISSVAWGGSGGATMAKAAYNAYNGKNHVTVNIAEGVSGAFNFGGAVAGGVGAVVAGTPAGRIATLASASLWAAGSGMRHVAELARKRYVTGVVPAGDAAASRTTAAPRRSMTPDRPVATSSTPVASSSTPVAASSKPAAVPAARGGTPAATLAANRPPTPVASAATGPPPTPVANPAANKTPTPPRRSASPRRSKSSDQGVE